MFANAMQFLLHSLDDTLKSEAVGSVSAALQLLNSDVEFDLVLIDHAMPGTDGFEGFKAIRRERPGLRIAFISGSADSRLVMRALDMGAAGWIPKTMSGKPLLHALRLILEGEVFVPPQLMQQRSGPVITLTVRENEVAQLLADGMADKEIAGLLSMQLGTVKVHVKSLLKKYAAENRTRFALLYRAAH